MAFVYGVHVMDTVAETIKLAGFRKKKMEAKQTQLFDDKFNDQGEALAV